MAFGIVLRKVGIVDLTNGLLDKPVKSIDAKWISQATICKFTTFLVIRNNSFSLHQLMSYLVSNSKLLLQSLSNLYTYITLNRYFCQY